ncbi:hypothetical protein PCE1_000235 [Barthelona sp. PCE]
MSDCDGDIDSLTPLTPLNFSESESLSIAHTPIPSNVNMGASTFVLSHDSPRLSLIDSEIENYTFKYELSDAIKSFFVQLGEKLSESSGIACMESEYVDLAERVMESNAKEKHVLTVRRFEPFDISMFEASALFGNVRILRMFLDEVSEVSVRFRTSVNGPFLIHWATMMNHREYIRCLFELDDVDELINLVDVDKNTPFHYAAMYNHTDLFDLLQNISRDRYLNNDGFSALHYLVSEGGTQLDLSELSEFLDKYRLYDDQMTNSSSSYTNLVDLSLNLHGNESEMTHVLYQYDFNSSKLNQEKTGCLCF